MGRRAAKRYAKATLELAIEAKTDKALYEDFISIDATIQNNKSLKLMLASPLIELAKKNAVLKEVFKHSNDLAHKLFDALAANNRIQILQMVCEEFVNQYKALNNIQSAQVVTAIPMNKEIETKVQNKIKEITGYTATLENQVDEKILGGFILKLNDLQFDASVSRSLSNFKRQLL
ncbi:ATP synthase F1 subunit delta [Psychroflexus aestuariivivens]|uniref:ATP synthase F1 subunit delta n=1 Tax=Psychroflexus aestuariivivens TaxID=1795040 RepID=UPI000FDA0C34|nr:ATP synthase F1 subunit delta [Psychroflexus aestuariivivens]